MPLISSLGVMNAINFGLASSVAKSEVIAMTTGSSPYIAAYSWNNGFGAKYADPSSNAGQYPGDVYFSSDNNLIGTVSATTSNAVSIYPWSNGFGTKYSGAPSLIGNTGFGFNAAKTAISIANSSSPYLYIYAWNAGFGTKYSNPATLPPTTCYSVTFNNTDNIVSVGSGGSPYIVAYNWSNSSGFGTKITDPTTLPSGTARAVTFNFENSFIAVAHDTSPYISTYQWNNSVSTWPFYVGFVSKNSNPSTLPSSNATGVSVVKSGASYRMILSQISSPYISSYLVSSSGGFILKYSDPATLPSARGNGTAFNAKGSAAAFTTDAGLYVYAYSNGFGSLYSNPVGIPGPVKVTFTN